MEKFILVDGPKGTINLIFFNGGYFYKLYEDGELLRSLTSGDYQKGIKTYDGVNSFFIFIEEL